MTDDKTERTMRFILEQQAQNTVAIGQLTEKVDKLSDKVDRNADGITALLAIAQIHEQEIVDLKESVSAVDVRGRKTDERLNALINTVERYISERRNGNAQN